MSDYVFINGIPCNADELKHYGVLGMKWGKKKARPTLGSARRKAGMQSAASDRASGKKITARQASINAKRARIKAGRSSMLEKFKEGRSGSLSEVNKRTIDYRVTTAQARKKLKGVARLKQKAKDWSNEPVKSITWKDSTRGKEYAKAYAAVFGTITVAALSAKVATRNGIVADALRIMHN